ncbi:hypothetical protein X474_26860 [Dethiosulfatarculus sandiegensis]|uniref:Uncharacterized protein n=1 Tax=Dethiosulfatarculus sandiegensis TaxID=1429043 RepID=A0A0D2J5M0_9BACT|nr:hypothetical protein X474_26860 [Dethiosulfatarculus sandiegensis]
MFLDHLPREMAIFDGLAKRSYPKPARAAHHLKSSLVLFKAAPSVEIPEGLQKTAEK